MKTKRVVIKLLDESANIPAYAHGSDSGADLYSIEDVVIKAGKHAKVRTGISVELPDGYELQVRSKSGIADKYNVFVLNSPGTIDTDYRGEIQVLLFNLSDVDYSLHKGQKIAQAVLAPVVHADYVQLERLEKGFGSTGLTQVDFVEKTDTVDVPTDESIKTVWINNNEDAGFVNGFLSLE